MFLDTSPLSEYEQRLLLLIWEHGVVTAETAQYLLDMTAGELGNHNRRLLHYGLIRRERTATSKTVTYRCTQLGRILADAVNRGQRVELVEPTGRRRNRAPVVSPACAGIDPWDTPAISLPLCLPRMRGDRPPARRAVHGRPESPPHARGST